MVTISGVIRNGQILPNEPIKNIEQKHCLITILDEGLDELRQISEAMLEDSKQERLSRLLEENKIKKLTKKNERELDSLLAEVHQLAVQQLMH